METIELNQAFIEKIKQVRYKYESKIPTGMYHYYKEILAGNNIEMYMEQFSLSKEDLLKYARVCKIIDIYNQIVELMEMAKEEVELLGAENIEEFQNYVDELQDEGGYFLNNFDEIEKSEAGDTINYGNSGGLIVYPSYIEESKQKIDNSRSGKGEETRKYVATIIEQMVHTDYMSLRKKGTIHQAHQTDTTKPCYIDGKALERMGNGTTKVTYLRLSLSEKNRETIKKVFNVDFDTLYLVLSYGDFKNDGVNEKQFYIEIYTNIKKYMKEIMLIIDTFKNDFTPEAYNVAVDLINNGLKTTEEIISITKNNRSDKLNI